MKRRECFTILGGAVVGWPLTACAQPAKIPRVGVLTPAQNDSTPIFNGLRRGLRDFGYVEGQTIILEFRFAKGILDALPGLAEELVGIPVDLIVTDGGSSPRNHGRNRGAAEKILQGQTGNRGQPLTYICRR